MSSWAASSCQIPQTPSLSVAILRRVARYVVGVAWPCSNSGLAVCLEQPIDAFCWHHSAVWSDDILTFDSIYTPELILNCLFVCPCIKSANIRGPAFACSCWSQMLAISIQSWPRFCICLLKTSRGCFCGRSITPLLEAASCRHLLPPQIY